VRPIRKGPWLPLRRGPSIQRQYHPRAALGGFRNSGNNPLTKSEMPSQKGNRPVTQRMPLVSLTTRTLSTSPSGVCVMQ
jgi:hypothetical protein